MQPVEYLNTAAGMCWIIACLPIGIILTVLAWFVLDHVPAGWLCEYDEEPPPELLNGRRVKLIPWMPVSALVVTAVLVFSRLEFNKGYDIYFCVICIIVFAALLITVADIRFQIIPDQFTIALGLAGAALSTYDLVRGYRILNRNWWDPLLGAAIGAVLMILIDLIGMLVYKKEGMGFGDVKLFFAVGLLTGFPGTIYTFLIAIVTATICFVPIMICRRRAADGEEPAEGVTADSITEKSGSEQAEPESEEPDKEKPADEGSAEAPDDRETASGISEKETNEAESPSEDEEAEKQEPAASGSEGYLAFGPYIAIAMICYMAAFDLIHGLVQLYLNLF